MLPWTVNVADFFINPRMLLATHVYTPPSFDVTSLIIKPPRDCTIRLSAGRLVFSLSHVIWGTGFPLTSHCSEATSVSFTTMETGDVTIEGAEMDSPGSPLGPWGPWSPLGPGGPWSPWEPLGPCGPWGPGGPCLPGGPGLPRRPLIPFGQWIVQAIWISFLVKVSLAFESLFCTWRFRRMCASEMQCNQQISSLGARALIFKKGKVKAHTSQRPKRPEFIPVSIAWSMPRSIGSPSQGYPHVSSMSPVPISLS